MDPTGETRDPVAARPAPDDSLEQTTDGRQSGFAAAPPPARLGDFRLVREVGRGGMGVVYEAVQESLGRRVALKVLPPQAIASPDQVRRFEREARSAAQLHHTNIVPVFGFGQQDGTYYYVMQFIEGPGLDDVLRALQGPAASDPTGASPARGFAQALVSGAFDLPSSVVRRLPERTQVQPGEVTPVDRTQTRELPAAPVTDPAEHDFETTGALAAGSPRDAVGRKYWVSVARLGLQVAEALAYAHEHGILHRDIKPSNLIVDVDGTVWVTDFGLARATDDDHLTQGGDIIGTVRYMAPERFEGQSDARGDVYSLGLTLYELVTRRPAFDIADRNRLIRRVLHREPAAPRQTDPAIPRDLETIVLKAIAKDPAQRYQTANALADDLRRFVEDRPIRARRASAAERVWRWCKRNPALATLAATTLALLLTVAVGSSIAVVVVEGSRRRADLNAAAETLARSRAEEALQAAARASDESRHRLVRLNLVTGNHELESGQPGPALLRYTQAWMIDRDDPKTEAVHRLRLAGLLERLPRLEGICFHTTTVLDASFGADGATVLTRSDDGRARLWDPSRARVLAELVHHGAVTHAAFAPDGKRIVTASADRTVRLWDAVSGKPLGAPLVHPAVVHYASFSSDGRHLVTGGEDKKVRTWDTATGKLLAPSWDCAAVVRYVAFNPNDTRVVTALDGASAQIWDAVTGKALTPGLPHHLTPGNPADLLFVPPLFSPDGQYLLTNAGTEAALWDAATGKKVRAFPSEARSINRVSFSPDGTRLLLVPKGTISRIHKVSDGAVLSEFRHPREVQAGCFSPDGRRVATSSSMGLLHYWDAQTGQPLATPFKQIANTVSLRFHSDGNRVLAAGVDGTAQIWSVHFEPFPARPYDFACGFANRIRASAGGLAFSPDGSWEVVASEVAGARLRRRAADEWGPALEHPEKVRLALFSPDGLLICTAGSGAVRVWEAASGKPHGPGWKPLHATRTAEFNTDGSRLLLVDAEDRATVFETATGRALLGPIQPPVDADGGRNHLFPLSPDGRRIAVTGGLSGALLLYEVASGTHYPTPIVGGIVARSEFSPDSRRLLTAASDTLARTWDAATGKPTGPPLRHPSFVRWAAFSPDGRLIVTRDDLVTRVWDGNTGDLVIPPLPRSEPAIFQVWFSKDGRRLIGQSPEGPVYQWELPAFRTAPDHVQALVHLLAGRQIDATDGVAPLDPQTFRKSPEEYRRAWLSWRGLDSESGSSQH